MSANTVTKLQRRLNVLDDVDLLARFIDQDDTGLLIPDKNAPEALQLALDPRQQARLDELKEQLRGRFQIRPEVLAQAARRRARWIIERAWLNQGGRRSDVGTHVRPVLDDSAVEDLPGGRHRVRFAGGRAETRSGGGAVFYLERLMEVRWVGMECAVRQEDLDELYGVVSCLGGFNHDPATATYRFGVPNPIELAPKSGGRRIQTGDVVLYTGPPAPVTLGVAQVEADSGDISATAQRIVSKIQAEAGKAVGAFTGAAGEAAAENETLHDVLVWAVDGVLGGLLGMSDDPYTGAALSVRAEEVIDARPVQQPPVTRPGSATIERWTHRVRCEGLDDAGDLGVYHHYFQVDIIDR